MATRSGIFFFFKEKNDEPPKKRKKEMPNRIVKEGSVFFVFLGVARIYSHS